MAICKATSTTPGLLHHSKSTSECDSTEPNYKSFLEGHYDGCPPIVIQEDDIQWLMMSPESPLYNPSRVYEPLPYLFPPAIGFCMDVGKADISDDMPRSVGAPGALFLGEDDEFHLEETTSNRPVKTKPKGPTLQVDTSAPNYHSVSSIEQGFTLSSLFSSPQEFGMKSSAISIDDRNAAADPDESG
jgi:hypothetical protein